VVGDLIGSGEAGGGKRLVVAGSLIRWIALGFLETNELGKVVKPKNQQTRNVVLNN
jgi:hypothetical protein